MSENTRSAVVLVHGAWGGAWIWRRVLAPLRDAGLDVHAATLTGLGDRARLRHPGITLQTHIDDVVALVEAEEITDVILVGHSYGGMVITGAAAALESAGTARVTGLVYVDAMVPLPGEGWGGGHSDEIVASRKAAAAAHDNALPPPDPSEGFALSATDAEWLRRRHVPHPFGMYQEPLNYDAELLQHVARLFIDCTEPAYPTIAPMRQRVRETPGWGVTEIRTGHFPMITEPEQLASELVNFATGTPKIP